MTTDPRATARQWLADTMCADLDIDLDKPSCRGCLEKADAIVSALADLLRAAKALDEMEGYGP